MTVKQGDIDTATVLELMEQVGEEVVAPRFRHLREEEVSQKTRGDFVTVADREAEVVLTRALHRLAPDALIVGEEASFANPSALAGLGAAEHAFTIDPVDGTANFVRGSDDYAMMIAELRNGEVVRSWIVQPRYGNAYVAERGGGVTLNGQQLRPPTHHDPPKGATSRRRWVGYTASGLLAPVISTVFCCGIDYPKALLGELDYLAYRRTKPWDHLPGQLMVEELGGGVIHLDGVSYTADSSGFNPIIASPSMSVARAVAFSWEIEG